MNLGGSAWRAARERGEANGPASAASGAAVCARLLLMDVSGVGTIGALAGDERISGGPSVPVGRVENGRHEAL
jgi:hypothetical protein